ncbi:MAG: homoserine dehydrogenase [Planctomycetes bacterium]|nr:homoserine dehydrogenase [Planctomycetota bacterium]
MTEIKNCGIGLVGAGVIGGGVAEMLMTRRELLARRGGVGLDLIMVADKDMDRALAAGVPAGKVVDDYRKLVANPDIDIVVELMGGTGIAYDVAMAALDAGKHLVTANKALLAERGRDIFAKAAEKKLMIAFEAAVAGGIPLLLSLREGLIANQMQCLLGIVNGTCNYILSEMAAKGLKFDDCLKEAQRLGFAEANPSADIDGFDSGHKLALLAALAFETWIDFPKLHIEGIRNISDIDIGITRELGYTLKLLAAIRPSPQPASADQGGTGVVEQPAKLFMSVHPALLKHDDPLASVAGSLNAVKTEGDAVMESMFLGRGAGRYPTASAVIADIVAVAKAAAYGGKGPEWQPPVENAYQPGPMEDYQARYYLRFSMPDRPGVMGKITTVLGNNNVSIAAMHQYETASDETAAQVCFITHQAREGDVLASLASIEKTDLLVDKPVLLRIED